MTYEDLCKCLLETGFEPEKQYEVGTWNFSRYRYEYEDGEALVVTFPKEDQSQCVGRVSLEDSDKHQTQNKFIYIFEGSKHQVGSNFTQQDYDGCMTHNLDECYDAIYEFLVTD